jgi:hypothetical protein
MKLRILLFSFLFLPIIISAQSPWVRSRGGFYAQLGFHTLPKYNAVFNSEGKIEKIDREISESTLQLYAEYGITPRLTLIASLPYKFLASGIEVPDRLNPSVLPRFEAGKIRGLGNTSFSLRRKIFEKAGVNIAATVKAELPASKQLDSIGLRTGYNAATYTPMISIGMGYKRAYWFAYGGYGFRTNDLQSTPNFGIEGGKKFKKLWIVAFTEFLGTLKVKNPTTQTPYNFTNSYIDNQQYVSVGFKGIYEINQFAGLVVTLAGAPKARLLPATPGIGAGFWVKWQ